MTTEGCGRELDMITVYGAPPTRALARRHKSVDSR
jgi:hypothetical protein